MWHYPGDCDWVVILRPSIGMHCQWEQLAPTTLPWIYNLIISFTCVVICLTKFTQVKEIRGGMFYMMRKNEINIS